MAALPVEQGKSKAFVPEQRFPVDAHGCDQRNLRVRQFLRKIVLFLNLRIAPAARTVELGDNGVRILDADLVDAVLVAVQRQQTPIGQQAGGVDGLQHGIRVEPVIGGGIAGSIFHGGIITRPAAPPDFNCSMSVASRNPLHGDSRNHVK
jgi:hypothetical protein